MTATPDLRHHCTVKNLTISCVNAPRSLGSLIAEGTRRAIITGPRHDLRAAAASILPALRTGYSRMIQTRDPSQRSDGRPYRSCGERSETALDTVILCL